MYSFSFSFKELDKVINIGIKNKIINKYQMFHEIELKEFQLVLFSLSIIHGKNKLIIQIILEKIVI